jgi:predicted DNA-binding transcriptional regulator AlpA
LSGFAHPGNLSPWCNLSGRFTPRNVSACSSMLAIGRTSMSQKIEKLLGRRELREIIPRTDMTLYRWQKSGQFPQAIKINNRAYWRESEVLEWQRRHGVAP